MKKILPFLFALSLIAGGCSKSEDAKPAATTTTPAGPNADIMGRWQFASDVRTVYTSTGAVASTTPTTLVAGATMELTATQYVLYAGNTVDRTINYTRNGDVLHFGTDTAPSNYKTIIEKKANKLVWTTPVDGAAPSAYPAIYTTTFTR